MRGNGSKFLMTGDYLQSTQTMPKQGNRIKTIFWDVIFKELFKFYTPDVFKFKGTSRMSRTHGSINFTVLSQRVNEFFYPGVRNEISELKEKQLTIHIV